MVSPNTIPISLPLHMPFPHPKKPFSKSPPIEILHILPGPAQVLPIFLSILDESSSSQLKTPLNSFQYHHVLAVTFAAVALLVTYSSCNYILSSLFGTCDIQNIILPRISTSPRKKEANALNTNLGGESWRILNSCKHQTLDFSFSLPDGRRE